jgi:spoIIIJ-associated protein
MDSVEAEGNNIDEAIENALKMLGATRDRVEIEILSNSARGLFGLGGRKARVRATPRRPIDTENLGDERIDVQPVGTARPAPAPPAAEAVGGTAEAQLVPTGLDAGMAERAAQVLREIVRLMDVRADVSARQEEDCVLLELSGDASGVLIGRRGQMLDAMEYLVNRVVSRDRGGPERIVVDSQNYRARRRESLEDLARRMGEQAKKKRKAVTLNPMSPRDRRIVHMVLQGDPSLATKSSGKGYFRKLVIIPAGAGKATRGDGPRRGDTQGGEPHDTE